MLVHRLAAYALVSLTSVCAVSTINFDLEASWKETPFILNVLESAAHLNEALYYSTVSYIVGVDQDNDDDDDYGQVDEDELVSDRQLFEHIKSKLDSTDVSFLSFSAIYKVHSPRIHAHRDFLDANSELLERVKSECAFDSFGNKILTDTSPNPEAFLVLNDKIYCSPDEVFALQTDSVREGAAELLPFDRIFGDNSDAPILILYGDIKSMAFRKMLKNLLLSAELGKLRFVWRYLDSVDPALLPSEELVGYGVDLTLKRTDYIAIDDTDAVDRKVSADGAEKILLTKKQSSQLGVQLTRKILQEPSYLVLREYLETFPSKISEISAYDIENDRVEENIRANEKLGLSSESIGLYINGAPLHQLELDAFSLVNKIKGELEIVNLLVDLGFSIKQSKLLVSKFALLSAVKQAQYYQGNTMMGNNENRYKLYQHKFELSPEYNTGGVVYFNDIELDDAYSEFPTDRIEAYTGESFKSLRQGQIPPLKENIHDIIFAIDVLDKAHLRIFFTLSKVILDRSLPQQLGLLPISLGSSDKQLEQDLLEAFYFITGHGSPKEGLALLYKYLESETEDEVQELIAEIKTKIPSDFVFNSVHKTTQDVFSIDEPSVVINGVITSLKSPNWQNNIGKQIVQDVKIIQKHLQESGNAQLLKSLLFERAGTKRNARIIPNNLSDLKYKLISEELIQNSILVKRDDFNNYRQIKPFWLVGNFNKLKLQKQLSIFLKLMLKDLNVQLRIINTGEVGFLEDLSLNKLSKVKIQEIIEKLESLETSSLPQVINKKMHELLASNKLPLSHSFILYNSRFLRLDELIEEAELLQLMKFESNQRIGVIEELPLLYSLIYDGKTLIDIFRTSGSKLSASDWFDLVTSIITKSFFVDDTLYLADVARFDFNTLNQENSLDLTESSYMDAEKEVDILLIIDPIDEFAQLAVSLLNSVIDFDFVNIKVLLQPNLVKKEEDSSINIKRFFRGQYPRSAIEFEQDGRLKSLKRAPISIPKDTLLTSELIVPSNWISVIKSEPAGVDLDNIQVASDDESISAKYELKNILVEGFAKDIKTANPPTGLVLEITKPVAKGLWVTKDTTVMSTLGYLQLLASPGLWDMRIKPDSNSAEYYSLLSANPNAFDANTEPKSTISIPIFTLTGRDIRVRVTKNLGYENKSLLDSDSKDLKIQLKKKTKKKSGFFGGLKTGDSESTADINIFSIVSGHLYERFLSIMTASVRKHTNLTVKFWIIENYISLNFKKMLPYLSQKYDFEYVLITYKWPKWLRQQREKQRTIWGYKILFLDVIFPQELDKIIFVDADQVVRTDMMELVNEDLEGKVYGFTPMCESREEMEGFRFWKQGYWKKVLGDTFRYHISALFVVDLKELRRTQVGNKLRSHYQKLSSDPNSLANLDQDLPNNLQKQIPIHSLDQDWLWCETWCSDDGLKRARTIDLCNNPLTKEPKINRAKRQIPEWVQYNDEVNQLADKMREELLEKEKEEEKQRQHLRENLERRNRSGSEDDEEGDAHVDDSDDDSFEYDEL